MLERSRYKKELTSCINKSDQAMRWNRDRDYSDRRRSRHADCDHDGHFDDYYYNAAHGPYSDDPYPNAAREKIVEHEVDSLHRRIDKLLAELNTRAEILSLTVAKCHADLHAATYAHDNEDALKRLGDLEDHLEAVRRNLEIGGTGEVKRRRWRRKGLFG